MEEASWRRHRGGGIREKASGRRHHGGGIIGEASWRRHHGGGIMASRDIWETAERQLGASGRHLGGIWGHLGGIWELGWPWEASGSQMCSNTCVLSAKVARPGIWCTRHELDLHVDRKFTATLSERGTRAEPNIIPPSPKRIRQNPYSVNTVWGKMD